MAVRKRALVWLGAAWLLVAVAAVVWGVGNADDDLGDRVAVALDDAGIDVTDVRLEGRDAVLVGIQAASEDEAMEVAKGVRGVRAVDIENVLAADTTVETTPETTPTTSAPAATSTTTTTTTTIAPATTTTAVAAAPVPTLSARLEGGALVLTGAIPDAESAARIAGLADLIYGPFVTNELVVDASLPTAAWVPGAAGSIAVLPIVGQASLDVVGDQATVTGLAPNELKQAQLIGAVQAALGESVSVTGAVEITGKEPPFFAASAPGEGIVTLDGVMPDEGAIERIVGTAVQVFGPENVVNEMVVGDNIDTTFSLFRVPLVFVLFQPVPEWQFRIENDVITGNLRGGATFAFGSAELTPELEALSDIAAGILLRNPTLALTIGGHTDSVGSDAFNQRLSEDRAQAAVDYIEALGVQAPRMTAIGFGETQPIGDNGTEAGRAQNRRIEFGLGPIGGQ